MDNEDRDEENNRADINFENDKPAEINVENVGVDR